MKSTHQPMPPCAKPDLELIKKIRDVRRALLIGLESFGEIERLLNRYPAIESEIARFGEGFMPVHPTESADTVGVFALALRTLDEMGPDLFPGLGAV